MAYPHLNGNEKISESYNRINENFDAVDAAATAHKTAATLDHPDGSVTTAKVADKAIVRAKIGDKAVGTGQLGDTAVGTGQIADKAVTQTKIGDAAVGTGQIADGSVTAAKVAADVATQAELDAVASAAAADATSKANAVNTALSAHTGNTDIHTTAAEKAKLAGISTGAEVNQNAFSHVNDIDASSKTDTLTLTGGTGITITTDPASKKLTVTATGSTTPGPHASSHITGGTDVIPNAVVGGASGLMSGSDAQFVRVDGETKAGAQAKADAAAAASIPLTQKGAVNGVATLDASGVVPIGQLPSGYVQYAVDSGTANAKVVTLSPAPTAYTDGMAISFKNATQNTGAVTINVNGLGAKDIIKSNGNALSSGNLKAGSIYTARYNSTTGNFILQGEGGEYGTAAAAQVLTGYTIGTDTGLVSGTMANYYGQSVNAQGTGQYGDGRLAVYLPAAGYYGEQGHGEIIVSPAQLQAADADLVANNIPSDKNIFGIQGTITRQGAYTNAASTAWDGSQLYVRFPLGVYQATGGLGYPEITLSAAQARADGNITANNIRNGISIYGVQGTLIEGKRNATGSMYVTGANTYETLTVTGLAFTPSIIQVKWANNSAGYSYLNYAFGKWMISVFNNYDQPTGQYQAPTGSVSSNGFSINVTQLNSGYVDWIAHE